MKKATINNIFENLLEKFETICLLHFEKTSLLGRNTLMHCRVETNRKIKKKIGINSIFENLFAKFKSIRLLHFEKA